MADAKLKRTDLETCLSGATDMGAGTDGKPVCKRSPIISVRYRKNKALYWSVPVGPVRDLGKN